MYKRQVWPQASAPSTRGAVGMAAAGWAGRLPLLRSNELDNSPLGLEAAVEAGDYWVGVVGAAESRRPVVLGAAVVDVMAMLELRPRQVVKQTPGQQLPQCSAARTAREAAPPQAAASRVLPRCPRCLRRINTPLPHPTVPVHGLGNFSYNHLTLPTKRER